MRIAELLEDHETMDAVLTRARRSWFTRRIDDSQAAWSFLATLLHGHMRLEEDHLLPLFEQAHEVSPNLSARVLRRDHQMIRTWLDTSLDADPVAVCDAMAQLQGVLEHHDLREAQALKPLLDETLGPAAEALLEPYARWRKELGDPPHPKPAVSPRGAGPTPTRPVDAARDSLARGDHRAATRWLDRVVADTMHGPAKAHRLATKALDALRGGDLAAAWDPLRLCLIVLDHSLESARPESGGSPK